MSIVRKGALAMMALLLSASTVSSTEQVLLINSGTGEYVEISCISEYSCGRCMPRQGWDMTSDPGLMLATGSESDYVIYGQMRDSWHCANCGNCKGMIHNQNDNLCTISLCETLPEGWRPAFDGECHYPQGATWVGPDSVECDDPCQSKTSCTNCVDLGCSWFWSEQTCRPTCDNKWPCITDDRDGMCQEFEQQQAWNEDCNERSTCNECAPSMLPTPCRWVGAADSIFDIQRCVGNICYGNCREASCPIIFLCDGLGVDGGEICLTQNNAVQCSRNGKIEEFICCCNNGEEDCTYVEGTDESMCALPQCDFSDDYGAGQGTVIPCTTQGEQGQCVASDGSIRDVICCCSRGSFFETPVCDFRIIMNESWCNKPSDVFPCTIIGQAGDRCSPSSSIPSVCFDEDWIVVDRTCCCANECFLEESSPCKFTQFDTCESLDADVGDSCSTQGYTLQCIENCEENADRTCCCNPGADCSFYAINDESFCPLTEVFPCEPMGVSVGDSCSVHEQTIKCRDENTDTAVDRTCCCDPGQLECTFGETSCVSDRACFMETSELRDAVGMYLVDPSNPSSSVAQKYGYPMNQWCVSNIQDFSELFNPHHDFNEDISGWDMASAQDFSRMFEYCAFFNQSIGNWDVSNVESMELMFADCVNFNQDLPWEVSSAVNMGGMFLGCSVFNKPIDKWNVSSVSNMGFMFSNALNFNQSLENWDVSSVVDVGNMFYYATSFDQPLGNWNVAKAEYATSMFEHATSFNQDVSAWQTNFHWSNRMFNGAASFSQSLCAWSRHLPDDAFNGSMFVDTKCLYQETEYLFPMKPMCMYCGNTCGDSAGIGPGQPCASKSDQEICMQNEDVVDLVCCHLWDEYIKQGAICICFSGENVVNEASKGDIKMKDLRIGDKVEVGENQYDRVYSFGHYDPDGKGIYLQIHARDLIQPLEVTPNHLVFVLQDGAVSKPVSASQIKLGDKVVLSEGRLSEVTVIKIIARVGFYAPFTESGKLLVSGVLASNYAVSVGELETVKIAGIDFSLHWLAHAFTFPHRVMCGWNEELCRKETYSDDDQMPAWISGPRRFFAWVLHQNVVIQSLILIPFVAYCSLVSMEEYVLPRWTSLGFALLFIVLLNSGCGSTGAALSRMSLDDDDEPKVTAKNID